jgi:hypothetical protein
MATVSELKIGELRKEISALEEAGRVKTTPASELAAAHAAIDGAERLLNLNSARRNDVEAVLENFQKTARGLIGPALEKVKYKIALQENEIRALTAERDGIETDLRAHRATLGRLTANIEAHPVYQKVRVKQSELIAEAVSLAKSCWTTPLSEVNRIIAKIANIASVENSFLSSCLAEIRANSLPEIAPRLHGLVERIEQIAPSFNAWNQANDEIQKVSEYAASVKRVAR